MIIQQNFDKCIDTMRAASFNVFVSKNDPKGATMTVNLTTWSLNDLQTALMRATLNQNQPLAMRLARELSRRVGA